MLERLAHTHRMEIEMGNRAVVTVEGSKVGVYLHWNGGEESVVAFLRAAKDLGVRAPTSDDSYFYARFVQIIGNFFGGTTSVGINAIESVDTNNGDNGTFVIGSEFQIVRRDHKPKRADDKYDKTRSEEIYRLVMEANQRIFKKDGLA